MSETVRCKIRNVLKIKCKSKFSAALIKTIAKKSYMPLDLEQKRKLATLDQSIINFYALYDSNYMAL